MPKPLQRIYKLSDAFLKQKCDSVAASMDRDGAEFAARGVTGTMTGDFADLSTIFGTMDSDEMLIGNVPMPRRPKMHWQPILKARTALSATWPK